MRETVNLVHDLTQRGIFLRTLGDKLAVDTSDPGPGTDMAITLLAMFAQMERIYMLERAAGARAAKQARGLPAGRPAKLNATTRAGAAQRIGDGAIPNRSPAISATRSRASTMPRPVVLRTPRRHRSSCERRRPSGTSRIASRERACPAVTDVARVSYNRSSAAWRTVATNSTSLVTPGSSTLPSRSHATAA